MKVFFATEFACRERDPGGERLAAGFVAENKEAWYGDITELNRQACADMVAEDEIRPCREFGGLVAWLAGFGETIELIAEASCHWWLISAYVGRELRALPHPVFAQVWLPWHDPQGIEGGGDSEIGLRPRSPRRNSALDQARRLKDRFEHQRAGADHLAASDADLLPPAGIRSLFLLEEAVLLRPLAVPSEGDVA